MIKLLESLPDVFDAINVIAGCVLVLLFLLIITSIDSNDWYEWNKRTMGFVLDWWFIVDIYVDGAIYLQGLDR